MKKYLVLFLVFALAGSVYAKKKKIEDVKPQVVVDEKPLVTSLDSLAYCYGIMFGTQYSNFSDSSVVVPGKIMDTELFLQAFIPAMRKDSAKILISLDDAQAYLQAFMMKLQEEKAAEDARKLQETKEACNAFLAENAMKPGVVKYESGLQMLTVEEGIGRTPVGDSDVRLNYKGSLIDGTVFDANDGLTLNAGQLIPGFSEGLTHMKEGGSYILYIPSELGYGDRAAGDIPAGSTLIFEITLISIVEE